MRAFFVRRIAGYCWEVATVFRVTAVFIWIKALLDALLTALTARPAAALLTTPTVVLYTAGPLPTMNQAFGNYTLATFSGYAAQAVTLSGVVNISLGTQALLGTALFVSTAASPFVPNTILGYLLTDGVTALYGGEQFQTPVNIASAGDFVHLDLVLPISSSGLNG
jgi:hypothetical protein